VSKNTDSELVRRTLAGDAKAFADIYDRYARHVRAVVGAVDVDSSQETFLRAYRNLSQLRDPERLGPWLVGIARTVRREQYRQRKHEPLYGDVPGVLPDPIEIADEMEYLLSLVARLPEKQRLAVNFYFLAEQDVNETARLLDRSRSGTYVLLNRALATLAAWLSIAEVQK
jgi:RNA polymerase sigma factor (sigma-70 family)